MPNSTIFLRKLFKQSTYQHLQLKERALIQNMLEQGYKPAAIALSLGRSRATISCELSRNNYIAPPMPRPVGRPFLADDYRCVRANQRARTLICKPRVPRRNGRWNSLVGLRSLWLIPVAIPRASQLLTMPTNE
jgi:IS30 family transposase